MFCKNCGHNMDAAAGFCPECGTRVEAAPAPSAPPPAAKKGPSFNVPSASAVVDKVKGNKTLMMAIGGGLLGLIVIIVGIVLLARMPHNPPYEVFRMGMYDDIGYIGDNRFVVERGGRWAVLNTRGNEIIGFGAFELPIDFYTNGNMIVRDRGEFSLLNARGRVVTTFDRRYDWVSFVSSNRFLVQQGFNNMAVIDQRGNYIIPMFEYDSISPIDGGNFYRVTDRRGDMGLLDSRGREIVNPGRYGRDASFDFAGGGRFIIRTGGRIGVINARGGYVIGLGDFDSIRAAGDSHFIAEDRGDWGVLNARGNRVIDFRYDNIIYAGGNFIVTEGRGADARVGVLNSRGNVLIGLGRYDSISYAGSGRFFVSEFRDGNWIVGVIDSRDNEVIRMGDYDEINRGPGDRFIVIRRDERGTDWGVIDARGREVIRMGMYDRIDAVIARPNDPTDFRTEGFIVRRDGVGFYNTNGQSLIGVGRYDEIIGVFDRMAIVRTTRDGRRDIGVINTRRSPR